MVESFLVTGDDESSFLGFNYLSNSLEGFQKNLTEKYNELVNQGYEIKHVVPMNQVSGTSFTDTQYQAIILAERLTERK